MASTVSASGRSEEVTRAYGRPDAATSASSSRAPGSTVTRPAAALALVDRDGNLLWFDWGTQELADQDPGAPATAAEAVDALLRVIRGDADAPDA